MAKANLGCGTVIGLLAVGGLIVSAPGAAAAIFLVVVFVGGLIGIALLAIVKPAKDAVKRAVDQHMPALVRRRAQLLTVDAYGTILTDKWNGEIRYFYDTQVSAGLTAGQRKAIEKRWPEIVRMVESAVAAAESNVPAFSGVLVETLSPYEFESYCAARLREAGWDANATKGSGDQGVDVIAERGGLRVALQCKLYSCPIGNKAVQEVAAGRVHYAAQRAAVVSNRSYTPSAEQLAGTNGVLLLHYTQLDDLAGMLGATTRPFVPEIVPTSRPEPSLQETVRLTTSSQARSTFGRRS